MWVFGLAVRKYVSPSSCGNHVHLRGGSDAERVRSTLAYGWVECCSDIAGCGEASS